MSIAAPENPELNDIHPTFDIRINGMPMSEDFLGLVRSIEYESTDNIADMGKVTFSNPNFILSNMKALQPGNEVSFYFGYGTRLKFVGRVEIARHHPTYPAGAMPTIEIIGYTADRRMMDHAPIKPPKKKPVEPDPGAPKKTKKQIQEEKKKEREEKKDKDNGRVWGNSNPEGPPSYVWYKKIIEDKCRAYGFNADVDDTGPPVRAAIQHYNMSDYEFIRGLANHLGYIFWVDGNEEKGYGRNTNIWTLHFKKPKRDSVDQDKIHVFKYNSQDETSLLNFRPEVLIQGQYTEVKANFKDPKTGKIVEFTFPEKTETPADDKILEVEPFGLERDLDEQLFGTSLDNSTAIKLSVNDFSFKLLAPMSVSDIDSLKIYAQQWYELQRKNFIMSEGDIVGMEDVMARQKHEIQNVHGGLDGLYYFSKVKHKIDISGYKCEFNARKIIETTI